MKILIIDSDEAKKLVFSTALIDNLKSHYTDAVIDFLIDSRAEMLLKSHPEINEVIAMDKAKLNHRKSSVRLSYAVSLGVGLRKNRYDILLTTSSVDDTAIVSLLSGAKTRVGIEPVGKLLRTMRPYTDIHEPIYSKHTIEKKLDTMRVLGLKISTKKPSLYASSTALAKVSETLAKYLVSQFVHVHLGSKDESRATDIKLIAKIIDYLEIDKKTRVVVTALDDVSESSRTLEALALAKSTPISLIGFLGLDGMIALSKKSMLFVGICDEVLHISATQQKPSIAIFGPDSAFTGGTWDGSVQESGYANQNGKQSMGIHTILQSADTCVPCEQNGCDNSGHSKCIDQIIFERIKSEIDTKLA